MAVTGATGRLGRALLARLAAESIDSVGWSRPEYDLDEPATARWLFERDQPEVVIHAAAWTDVDGCARDPEAALRRNADAVGELAQLCADQGARMVLVSTNEVFNGERTDGVGYRETDPATPANAYGTSKRAGELRATNAYERAGRSGDLLVTRTAWLFGPPGNDFPSKILAAADSLPQDEPLKVVADEVGSPTYSVDLAEAVFRLLVAGATGGIYHLVNDGRASRLDMARRVLARCRPARETTPISRREFVRASVPPAWAVLENARASSMGIALRPWQDAVDGYLPSLCAA